MNHNLTTQSLHSAFSLSTHIHALSIHLRVKTTSFCDSDQAACSFHKEAKQNRKCLYYRSNFPTPHSLFRVSNTVRISVSHRAMASVINTMQEFVPKESFSFTVALGTISLLFLIFLLRKINSFSKSKHPKLPPVPGNTVSALLLFFVPEFFWLESSTLNDLIPHNLLHNTGATSNDIFV